MPPLRISLVMPNFNHARFIGQALGALLTQTRPPDEIIVIDDASTDDSIQVIEGLVRDRPEVSIIRNKDRGGALKALNDGLARASGDLIAFPAADDLLGPDFLKETEALLQGFPEAPFCSACVDLVDSEGRKMGNRPVLRPRLSPDYVPADAARAMFLRGDNFFLGPVTLYRREPLRDLGGFDAGLGAASDGMMQRRMAVRWGFCFIPRVLGTWRLHGANYSAAAVESPERLDHLVAVTRQVIESEPTGLFPESYGPIFERRLRFNAARLAILRHEHDTSRDVAPTAICNMIQGRGIDRTMLRLFQRFGPLATFLSMGWISLRLRPFSFAWLGMETVRRKLARPPGPTRRSA